LKDYSEGCLKFMSYHDLICSLLLIRKSFGNHVKIITFLFNRSLPLKSPSQMGLRYRKFRSRH